MSAPGSSGAVRTTLFSLPDGAYDHITLARRILAALTLGQYTLNEIQAMMPNVHPRNVEAALRDMVESGEISTYTYAEDD